MRAKYAHIDYGCLTGKIFLEKVEDMGLRVDGSVYHPP
jgi:hypothetical protein